MCKNGQRRKLTNLVVLLIESTRVKIGKDDEKSQML